MPRPTNPKLRRAILDVARRVLIEQGYPALAMRPIAREVGCTATSIYLHFDSKDALIHALIDEGMELLGRELRAALAAGATPRDRLQRLARAYLSFGLENPEYYEIMFMLHPSRMERYPAENYRRARRNLDFFHQELAAALGPAAADRDLRAEATLLWTSLHGTVSLLIAGRIDAAIDRDKLVELAVAQVLRSLSPPPLLPESDAARN